MTDIAVHDRLTKEQINATTDLAELEAMADEAGLAVKRIESALEFKDGSDEWEGRAISALGINKFLADTIKKRIQALNDLNPPADKRAREECHSMTWELIDYDFSAPFSRDIEDCAKAIAWMGEAIDHANADLQDERCVPMSKRDTAWVGEVTAAMRKARARKHELSLLIGARKREAKEAERRALESAREALFIDQAREVLPRETFLMLWDRVDRLSA